MVHCGVVGTYCGASSACPADNQTWLLFLFDCGSLCIPDAHTCPEDMNVVQLTSIITCCFDGDGGGVRRSPLATTMAESRGSPPPVPEQAPAESERVWAAFML